MALQGFLEEVPKRGFSRPKGLKRCSTRGCKARDSLATNHPLRLCVVHFTAQVPGKPCPRCFGGGHVRVGGLGGGPRPWATCPKCGGSRRAN